MRAAYTVSGLALLALAATAAEAPPKSGDAMGGLPRQRPTPVMSDAPPGHPDHGSAKAGSGSGKTATTGKAKPGKPAKPGASVKSAATADPAAAKPATPAIEQDTIILVNEQRFRGTVLSEQPDPAWVAINTGSGVMRLPRDSVAKVEFGLTARMGRVKDDDLAGLVDLAYWCRANNRNPQALVLLTKAVALPGCDLITRGLYAQLVDEQDGADKALPLYLAYRNAGGADPEIIARLAELEAARQAWEEQMRGLGLNPATGGALASATAVAEGMEKYKWSAGALAWSAVAKPSMVTITTDQGPRKILQVDVEPHPTDSRIDKAVVLLSRKLNLAHGTKLTFQAANRSEADLRLGIALKTGEWIYFESPPQLLPQTSTAQEFTTLTFDLSAANFKSAASNWNHNVTIADLDKVQELQILIHNGSTSGSVWLAGIAFESGSP